MNPVLCVFEKLAYKVGKFHKKLAEFLLFVVPVRYSLSFPCDTKFHKTIAEFLLFA